MILSCSNKLTKKVPSSAAALPNKRRSLNIKRNTSPSKDESSSLTEEKKPGSSWRRGKYKGSGGQATFKGDQLTAKKVNNSKSIKNIQARGAERVASHNQRAPSRKSKSNSSKRSAKLRIPPFVRREFDLQLECIACGKKIHDVLSAIVSSQDSREVYHFDCVLKHLKEFHQLKDDEDILYVGGGDFAVVRYKRKVKGKVCFGICERIEFEPKKEEQLAIEWRKTLRQS